MNKKMTLSLLASVALLSGCNREPNQQQLQQLYTEKVNTTNQLAERITQQKGSLIKVKSFEKIDCHQIKNAQDYECRAKITIALPFLGAQQNTTTLHVAKAEHGWVIID